MIYIYIYIYIYISYDYIYIYICIYHIIYIYIEHIDYCCIICVSFPSQAQWAQSVKLLARGPCCRHHTGAGRTLVDDSTAKHMGKWREIVDFPMKYRRLLWFTEIFSTEKSFQIAGHPLFWEIVGGLVSNRPFGRIKATKECHWKTGRLQQ